MIDAIPWLTLAALGVFHGLNPGMGWLFAVALGLQERTRVAVLRSFGPIALGHAASVAAVVLLVGLAHTVVDTAPLRVVGGAVLVVFGLYKLLAPLSHPRWVGMRVTGRDLTAWSFLMSTAHGAGLMLVPVVLRLAPDLSAHTAHAAPGAHAHHTALVSETVEFTSAGLALVGVHTLAMFLAMGLIALVVYEKVGLAILRRAWFNLDRLWAGALIAAGAVTLIL